MRLCVEHECMCANATSQSRGAGRVRDGGMMFWMLTAWAHWAPSTSDCLVFQSWYCSHFHWQEIETRVTFSSAILAPTDFFFLLLGFLSLSPSHFLSFGHIFFSLPLFCVWATAPSLLLLLPILLVHVAQIVLQEMQTWSSASRLQEQTFFHGGWESINASILSTCVLQMVKTKTYKKNMLQTLRTQPE